MARMFAALERFFVNLRSSFLAAKPKDKFVGSDNFGNKYYERVEDKDHLRGTRYIQERKMEAHEVPEVPVEWNAWLRGTRKDPPTPEEIERNRLIMTQTKLRAAHLDKQFSGNEPFDTASTSGVAEDIKPSSQKVPFPKYSDLESAAGELSKKSSKVK